MLVTDCMLVFVVIAEENEEPLKLRSININTTFTLQNPDEKSSYGSAILLIYRGGDYMSLTRLVTFVIGLVLAIVGLMMLLASPSTIMPNLVIGLVLIVVGIIVMSGKVLSL